MPPTHGADFALLRRRAGNLSVRDLVAAAEAAGWTFSLKRGKGSHGVLTMRGRRPVVVPRRLKRRLTLSIIRDLERGASDA